jgi:preprotein translocase subunit SecG
MSIVEIIGAVLLILSCILIIVVTLMQETKRGMSQSITGASTDNYYQKNSGRSKEAKLKRATKVAAILLFVLAFAVNAVFVYGSELNDLFSGSSQSETEIIPIETDDITLGDTSDDTTAAETTAAETTAADTTAAE